jgi:hypothetical protein
MHATCEHRPPYINTTMTIQLAKLTTSIQGRSVSGIYLESNVQVLEIGLEEPFTLISRRRSIPLH